MTWPAGSPEICTVAVEPGSKPRWLMLMAAALALCPTTWGIATRCGPRLSARRSSHPRRTIVPAAGICDKTLPRGTTGL